MIPIRLKCKCLIYNIGLIGELVMLVITGFITNLFTGFGGDKSVFFTFGLSTLNPFFFETETNEHIVTLSGELN